MLNDSLPKWPRSQCSSCGAPLPVGLTGHQCDACRRPLRVITCADCGHKWTTRALFPVASHRCPAPRFGPRDKKTPPPPDPDPCTAATHGMPWESDDDRAEWQRQQSGSLLSGHSVNPTAEQCPGPVEAPPATGAPLPLGYSTHPFDDTACALVEAHRASAQAPPAPRP